MAWSIIPYHDEPGGPCKACKHVDCEASRRQVTQVCRRCKKPIGFGAKFAHDGLGCAMHWVCLINEAQEQEATAITSCQASIPGAVPGITFQCERPHGHKGYHRAGAVEFA